MCVTEHLSIFLPGRPGPLGGTQETASPGSCGFQQKRGESGAFLEQNIQKSFAISAHIRRVVEGILFRAVREEGKEKNQRAQCERGLATAPSKTI